ncbi:MAG: methanol--corrinoid methyltransferase [Phycisphaerae bacterium]|nr:methanol--corrinoid methyltransferase [Phycisphaerae bacterium]
MANTLKINKIENFLYGKAPSVVRCGREVEIGAGQVIPEINFTLPMMTIDDKNWCEVIKQYEEIIDGVLKRAVRLEVPQLLVEFETLPEMTNRPQWGLEITRLLADKMDRCYRDYGLKSALRLTINDVREFNRPPLMRSGKYWGNLCGILEGSAEAGADLIAIESTGGKEIGDEALVNCDVGASIFALGVLGARDMEFLWNHITDYCNRTGVVPSGDSACGFANTAMVLAEQNMIPRVFAAIVRVISVPRSLVAIRQGAKGPTKDCAYEGPYLKAIAGVPISMEGKSAACAHLSPVGNVSQAVCDCWSNESTQNIRMLSANAPTVSMEQLAYDCRLMNVAASEGIESIIRLRDWLSESDSPLDPQAYVLKPEIVLEISERIIAQDNPYEQSLEAARSATEVLKRDSREGKVKIKENELKWLDMIEQQLETLPEDEEQLIEQMLQRPEFRGKFLPAEYGI